jgi:hypothetical protein
MFGEDAPEQDTTASVEDDVAEAERLYTAELQEELRLANAAADAANAEAADASVVEPAAASTKVRDYILQGPCGAVGLPAVPALQCLQQLYAAMGATDSRMQMDLATGGSVMGRSVREWCTQSSLQIRSCLQTSPGNLDIGRSQRGE